MTLYEIYTWWQSRSLSSQAWFCWYTFWLCIVWKREKNICAWHLLFDWPNVAKPIKTHKIHHAKHQKLKISFTLSQSINVLFQCFLYENCINIKWNRLVYILKLLHILYSRHCSPFFIHQKCYIVVFCTLFRWWFNKLASFIHSTQCAQPIRIICGYATHQNLNEFLFIP